VKYWVNYKRQVIIFSLMNVKVEGKTKTIKINDYICN
jgi:hypothetical protein